LLRKAQSNCAFEEGPAYSNRSKPTLTAFILNGEHGENRQCMTTRRDIHHRCVRVDFHHNIQRNVLLARDVVERGTQPIGRRRKYKWKAGQPSKMKDPILESGMVGPPDEEGVDDTQAVLTPRGRSAVSIYDNHIESSGTELLVETAAESFGHV
jgi:hypothetical protein